ncbi:accessory factor UbiK family protein [Ectothiorhodospiraceae bacterium 2226]|nr:accessory factor UbiK family protein [Ectothiorhodospiraceae bacterium 2226]
MDLKMFDDLARRVLQAVPSGAELKADVDKNVRQALRSGLAQLDVVTREEFDVQMEVLARTRAKLEALEAKVMELEARLLPTAAPNKSTKTSGKAAPKAAPKSDS